MNPSDCSELSRSRSLVLPVQFPRPLHPPYRGSSQAHVADIAAALKAKGTWHPPTSNRITYETGSYFLVARVHWLTNIRDILLQNYRMVK